MKQIKASVLGDKVEAAVTLCTAHSKVPLAHVIKALLERADREARTIASHDRRVG